MRRTGPGRRGTRANVVTDSEAVLPDRIFEIGYAFWKSKALLSAVELGVFTALGDGPLDGETLEAPVIFSTHSSRSTCSIAMPRATTPIGQIARAISMRGNRPMSAARSSSSMLVSIRAGAN